MLISPKDTVPPKITGKAHIEELNISQKETEVTLSKADHSIIILVGNSRTKVAYILTPGVQKPLAEEDILRMELALREPFDRTDFLLKHGSLELFRAVKERALTLGFYETPAYHEAMRKLELLTTDTDTPERVLASLYDSVFRESSESHHVWREMIHTLLATREGRMIFPQIRQKYLALKRAGEEREFAEFRAFRSFFLTMVKKLRPTHIFIGTSNPGGSMEIIARDLAKQSGDTNPKIATQVVSVESGTRVSLKDFKKIEGDIDFDI